MALNNSLILVYERVERFFALYDFPRAVADSCSLAGVGLTNKQIALVRGIQEKTVGDELRIAYSGFKKGLGLPTHLTPRQFVIICHNILSSRRPELPCPDEDWQETSMRLFGEFGLTAPEAHNCTLIALGYTNDQAACARGKLEPTIRTQILSTRKKLQEAFGFEGSLNQRQFTILCHKIACGHTPQIVWVEWDENGKQPLFL